MRNYTVTIVRVGGYSEPRRIWNDEILETAKEVIEVEADTEENACFKADALSTLRFHGQEKKHFINGVEILGNW